MAFVASNILAGAGNFLNRLTAHRASLLDGLTAARGTLLDNLSRLNGNVVATQHQVSEPVTVVPGTGNVKGNWHELLASTSFDTTLMIVALTAQNSGNKRVDIGIGASGSETVLIPDIRVGTYAPFQTNVPVPVRIASGSRISARVSTSATLISEPDNTNVVVALSG